MSSRDIWQDIRCLKKAPCLNAWFAFKQSGAGLLNAVPGGSALWHHRHIYWGRYLCGLLGFSAGAFMCGTVIPCLLGVIQANSVMPLVDLACFMISNWVCTFFWVGFQFCWVVEPLLQ
ncbi:hypothetical protein DFH08DRAFT_814079 [Mycena albidolilacea]|uniref:Uncharacterized protein n=1 Tax=Mycena albidolilacea TaxID=1033008 RepID=A0AAD6ZPW9_9AGAR|nr:hypothetical protein DFH08DRAFT_814079 [Mycena albidolilacea]